jgi:hypothetical protein
VRNVFVSRGAVGRMSWAESVDGAAEGARAREMEQVMGKCRGCEGAVCIVGVLLSGVSAIGFLRVLDTRRRQPRQTMVGRTGRGTAAGQGTSKHAVTGRERTRTFEQEHRSSY